MSAETLSLDLSFAQESFQMDLHHEFRMEGCLGVLGRSGGGKTTLLRLIAGFERPQRGRIAFGKEVWCDTAQTIFVPPEARSVGYMFQSGALFPHMTVEQNLRYADKRRLAENGASFEEIVQSFDLVRLLQRNPCGLSGGERQRVALARTLLTRPALLLLDEPLSALDAPARKEILTYLDALPQRFDTPVIYVSHAIEEIAALSDRVLLVKDGHIEAYGAVGETLNQYGLTEPATEDHPPSILEGTVASHDRQYQLTQIILSGGSVYLPLAERKSIGDKVRLCIDPRNVAISLAPPTGMSIRNILQVKISAIEERLGTPFVDIVLDADAALLRAQLTRAALADLKLDRGQSVHALIKSASFDL